MIPLLAAYENEVRSERNIVREVSSSTTHPRAKRWMPRSVSMRTEDFQGGDTLTFRQSISWRSSTPSGNLEVKL